MQGSARPAGRRWPLLAAFLAAALALTGCSEVQLAINVVKKLHRETGEEPPAESREAPSIGVPLPAGPKPVGHRGARNAVAGGRSPRAWPRSIMRCRSPLPSRRQRAEAGR